MSLSSAAFYALAMPLNASENCLLIVSLAMVAVVAVAILGEAKGVILMVAVAATIGAR